MITAYPLQEVVEAGYAPSVRWLAEGIKHGRIPGRMIGRYWSQWRMTERDLAEFLGTAKPDVAKAEVAEPEPTDEPVVGIIDGLSSRGARRLRMSA